jgi:hypothetical protein
MKKLIVICTVVFVLLCLTSCETLSDDDWFNLGFAGGWWLGETFFHYEPDNSDRPQPAVIYSEKFKVSRQW